jgi:hypothetical protein
MLADSGSGPEQRMKNKETATVQISGLMIYVS